jgi:rod shape-determining protein MreC
MTELARQIRAHRPAIVFATLGAASLVSLLNGTETTLLHSAIKRAVELSAYPFHKGRMAAEDAASYVYTLFADHSAMREENRSLRDRVTSLREAVAGRRELEAENARLRTLLEFQQAQPDLDFVLARVMGSMEGMLTVDRGRFHGVTPSTPVLVAEGVVGIVVEADDFTAKVATLHHRLCKIGAMVQRNRLRAYDGVVHADGSFRSICNMFYIDLQDDVRIGDLVVTSPESLFPAGYPIGRITNVHEGDTLWKWAEVKPMVDPYRLDEVYLVFQRFPAFETLAGPPPAPGARDGSTPPPPAAAAAADTDMPAPPPKAQKPAPAAPPLPPAPPQERWAP